MAITVTNPVVGKFGWIANGVSADASLTEPLVAAPGAGLSIIVDFLCMNCGSSALSLTVGEDEAANDIVTKWIGPIAVSANSSLQFSFPSGMVLTSNKSFTVKASGAGPVTFFAYGRIQ